MNVNEILKKYSVDKTHPKTVSRLSLLLFEKIKPYFINLENYNNKNDLALLEAGAILHDIGIKFEEAYNLPHNKAGAEFIFNNKPDEIKEEDLGVLACLIRYHRKSAPKEGDKFYKNLSYENKAKVNYLASIIKLADSFDYMHLNLIEDFEVKSENNFLTLFLDKNIMFNKSLIKNINKKKTFFEEVFGVEIKLCEK